MFTWNRFVHETDLFISFNLKFSIQFCWIKINNNFSNSLRIIILFLKKINHFCKWLIILLFIIFVKDKIKRKTKFKILHLFQYKDLLNKDFQLTDFFLDVKLFRYTLSVLKGTRVSFIASITLFIDVLPSGHDVQSPLLRKQIKHDEAWCIRGEYISLRYRVIIQADVIVPFPYRPFAMTSLFYKQLSVLIIQIICTSNFSSTPTI